MKKPPCKVEGVECDKRHIGCRNTCDEWLKWQAVHDQERAAREKYINIKAEGYAFARNSILRMNKRNRTTKKVGQR